MFGWIKKTLEAGASSYEPRAAVPGVEISPNTYRTVYAIGDIHGRLDLLREAEQKIDDDIGRGPVGLVVYLGDYIDRGPDSSGVLEHLHTGRTLNFHRLCLRGNHDDVFLQFLQSPKKGRKWLDLGGVETLRSYGLSLDEVVDASKDEGKIIELLSDHIPLGHREFLDQTPLWAKMGSFLFVHAGIRPGVSLERQDPADLLWIREPFIIDGPQLPLTVIHGHTPAQTVSYGPNRIGIDTGAYATGRLTVLKIVGDETFEL